MKTKTIKFRTLVSLLLLLAAVICVINVTYSFFSSTKTTEGTRPIGNFQVSFYYFYYKDGNVSTEWLEENCLKLVPTEAITRGEPFKVKISEDNDVSEIGIRNRGNYACYVRFWIDAYVEGDDTNYGKYFELQSNAVIHRKLNDDNNLACYYLVEVLGVNNSFAFYNSSNLSLTMKDLEDDPIPLAVLGKTITITISFDAVQTTNQAFKSEFADERGYYEYWV